MERIQHKAQPDEETEKGAKLKARFISPKLLKVNKVRKSATGRLTKEEFE